VKKWLTFNGPIKEPEKEEPGKVKIKCPEIPVLKDYNSDPGKGPCFRKELSHTR
jgi:hypothetical protein